MERGKEESVFTGSFHRASIEEQERAFAELDMPFSGIIIETFENYTDQKNRLVGSAGIAGDVEGEGKGASMRMFRRHERVFLEVFYAKAEDMNEVGWDDSHVFRRKALEISAGTEDISWFAGKGHQLKYAIRVKPYTGIMGSMRLPNHSHNWLLGFLSDFSQRSIELYGDDWGLQSSFWEKDE